MPNYRVSRYIVETPPFIDKGGVSKRVVFSTIKCIPLIIEVRFWEQLKASPSHTDRPPELEKAGIIVDELSDEFSALIRENKEHSSDGTKLKLILLPTRACQLNCTYCGQSHFHLQMGEDIQQAAIKRLLYKIGSTQCKELYIGWFGAEPLLGLPIIRNLSRQILEICQKFQLRFKAKLITNGLLLKSGIFKELVKQWRVDEIEITLDGDQDSHDRRRVTTKGSKSFETIWRNIDEILSDSENHGVISIRANADSSNMENISSLIDKIHKAGWHKKIKRFYIAPVHSWGNSASIGLTKERYAELEIELLSQQILDGFPVSLLPSRVTSRCTATHKGHELIDAHGEVFCCNEYSFVPAYESPLERRRLRNAFAAGSVFDANESLDQQLASNEIRRFQDRISTTPCANCVFYPCCGGGCSKLWLEGHTPCPSFRYNIEERLLLKAALQHGITSPTAINR